ncbi:Tau class glutathione transferase GSTU45 [Hibiscus syriacus]|uniref:glutathione transferase n=1 Tax=Hibiscus syriacus TaxID=106335 RepID=A0A6A2XWI1_HIBSY|nr:Tau class glutathione transferase GSTU45 [Hibiscus syriacus]
MGEEVKVFGFWSSPYTHRVVLALRLKGVSYEYIEEEIFGNKSPLLLQYNPIHKKLPVLLHKGKPIAESRVMARFWDKFFDDKCMPAIVKAFWCPENEREQAEKEACKCLKMLESTLNEKRFFGGEDIVVVDIAANFIGFWLRTIQEVTRLELLSAEKFPDLFKLTDEFVNHSVVKGTLPARHKQLEFNKFIVAKY